MSSPRSSTPIIVKGTCHHDCPDSCGWEVVVDDGVAVKMRGNPEHPYSQGELCPKVNRFVDRVYSPDRVLRPLVRTGRKGAAEFRETTWEEALGIVADRLHEIIARDGGEAIMPWGDAGTQGLLQMNCLDRRFFARLGASRQIDALCGATAKVGSSLTFGSPLGSDPMDVRFSKLILLWGTNTRLTNRHLWPFIEEARANGAKVVVIDPVRTITAESADWFIQPLPGTDVALMLAMMHVLIRDGLIDRDYVNRHTEGFDELAAHVREWNPHRAAEVCGIDAADIETLARQYGTVKPVMIRTLIGAEHRENGAMFFRTITCLPTLVGAWRHRGGGYSRSVGSYNNVNIDDSVFDVESLETNPDRRSLSMNKIGRNLTDDTLSPPVSALFVYNGNPLVTAPNAALIRRGLEREDLFTVVSEQFITDTARYADVIFPACTQIEQLDVVPAWGHLYLGWNHQAIEPLGESVPNTELWRRLSRAMGFDEPELFESDESLLDSALHGLDVEALKRDGFHRLSLPEDLLPYAEGGYPTQSGKALLVNSALGTIGLPVLPTYQAGRETLGGDPDLSARFPLSMMSSKVHVRFLNASYSHLEQHAGPEGSIYCELHPDDATSRGISDGDRVNVFNDRATLQATARVSSSASRVRPGVVIVPFGWVGERTNDGNTVNMLTSDTAADWGGGVAFYDTLVEVNKID
ncbi:MAG: molybdopterin-containing oxidoreductase family protein [Ilumatobacteraceae bacterium]